VHERTLPELGVGQVRIRTSTTLISPGTERAFFLGLPNTTQIYPQFTGYNNIGTIVEVGPSVSDREVGMVVASPAHHASLVQIDATETSRVPDGVENERAVFFNMVSIALQGVRKARIEIGENVLVIGSGLIGLLAAQLARINGGLPVSVADRDLSRLEFAHALGLDTLHMAPGHNEGDGASFPVVIEATGHPDAVNTAFGVAAPFGRVVLLGSTRGITGEVNFYRDVHRKGLHVIGAHDIARPVKESYPAYWTQAADREVALRLLAAGRIDVAPLITHRFSSDDAPDAYGMLRNWDASALGIVLDWKS
jgi:L-iditol 2-dehydrogenase